MAKRSVEVQVLDSDFSVLLRESVTYEFKMESRPKQRFRNFIMFLMFLALTGIIYFSYFCSDSSCSLTPQVRVRQATWSATMNDGISADSDEMMRLGYSIQDSLGQPLSLHSSPINSKTSNPGLSYDDVLNENFQVSILED